MKSKEQLPEQPRQLRFDSDNLAEAVRNNLIPRTHSGLLRAAFLLGSTNFDWRRFVEGPLHQAGIATVNPDMGSNWNPDLHPYAEALAMSECTVLAMRIENAPGMKDGSLGSLVEIGMAVAFARLRGQKVIVTFAEGFEDSLEDPSAISQFLAIQSQLEDAEGVEFHTECSHEQYIDMVKKAIEAQDAPETSAQAITEKEIQTFVEKKKRRLAKKRRFVTIGGAGTGFKGYEEAFQTEQSLYQGVWGGTKKATVLTAEPFNILWDYAYDAYTHDELSKPEQKEMFTIRGLQAFYGEVGPKERSDVLVWIIQDKAKGQAAITELGWMVEKAINKGQTLATLLENFDVNTFTQTEFGRAKELRRLIAEYEGDPNAHPILEKLTSDLGSVTFADIKNSPLKKDYLFWKVDNANRTRAVAQKQTEKLYETAQKMFGKYGAELFTFAKDGGKFIEQTSVLSNPDQAGLRIAQFERYGRVRKAIEAQIEANRGKQLSPTQAFELVARTIIANAGEEGFATAKHAGELRDDMEHTQRAVRVIEQALANKTNAAGEAYLSPQRLQAMSNFVAPTYREFELLAPEGNHTMADSELMYGYIVDEYFPKLGFNPSEVAFLTGVLSNYKNLYRETGRTGYSQSASEAERGVALFTLADTLGSAVVMTKQGELSLDPVALMAKFGATYESYINPADLAIASPRPMWGYHTVRDMIATLDTLEGKYGVKIAENARQLLVEAVAKTISKTKRSLQQNRSVRQTSETLSADQMVKLNSDLDEAFYLVSELLSN